MASIGFSLYYDSESEVRLPDCRRLYSVEIGTNDHRNDAPHFSSKSSEYHKKLICKLKVEVANYRRGDDTQMIQNELQFSRL